MRSASLISVVRNRKIRLGRGLARAGHRSTPSKFAKVVIFARRRLTFGLCAPADQEEFFAAVGGPVGSRPPPPPQLPPAGQPAPPPKLRADEQAARWKKAEELAPTYRTELLSPDGAAQSER